MDKELECLKRIDMKLYVTEREHKIFYSVVEQALHRLESIENANPSEALECLEYIENKLKDLEYIAKQNDNEYLLSKYIPSEKFNTIKQALLKAQEQELNDSGRLPNKEILYLKQSLEQCNDKPIFYVSRTYGNKYIVPQKQLDDLVKEKELFEATIEDLRKDITLLKEQKTKKYLKWEDLEKFKDKDSVKVKMNDTELSLIIQIDCLNDIYVQLYKEKEDGNCVNLLSDFFRNKELFNDLRLELLE